MRGKHRAALTRFNCFRITPADAGKTQSASFECAIIKDHPRGCGENRHFDAGFAVKVWITPADAGKTAIIADSTP